MDEDGAGEEEDIGGSSTISSTTLPNKGTPG